MNALQLCRSQFSRKETLNQTFFKQSAILEGKRQFYVFEAPLWDLGQRIYEIILGSLKSA